MHIRTDWATSSAETEVALIGAGPYGLSISAHLSTHAVPHRVFGRPMESWRAYMPEGMLLKSASVAANLSDPSGEHTLKQFCALNDEPYSDWYLPAPIEVFSAYGVWFQERLVPHLDTRRVRNCVREGDGYRLQLDGGGSLFARRVIACAGQRYAARRPPELDGLPSSRVTHSSEHRSFEALKGLRVAVLGRGQSALETAALLNEGGAFPTLVARADKIVWAQRDAERPLYKRLRYPRTPIGHGWRHVFFDHPARPFHMLPSWIRKNQVESVLGPFGSDWLKSRVEGVMPILMGHQLRGARTHGDEITLQLYSVDGPREVIVDHVIAATGYRQSPDAFPFLAPELRRGLAWEHGAPKLSRRFESSSPGLYFAGPCSAYSFGPVMRFVAGVHHTAPALAGWLAADVRRAERRARARMTKARLSSAPLEE